MKSILSVSTFWLTTIVWLTIVFTTLVDAASLSLSPANLNFNTQPEGDGDSEEIQVQVEILNKKRTRRHISPLSTQPDFEYRLKISSISTSISTSEPSQSLSYDLNLKPVAHSVFSPDFKYTQLGRDNDNDGNGNGNGNPVTNSFFVSRNELDSIEARLYTDPGTKSYVRLEHDESENLELYGVIDGARIRTRTRTRRDTDSVTGSSSRSYSLSRPPPPTRIETVDVTGKEKDPGSEEKDYLIIPPTTTLSRRTGAAPLDLTAWANIEPELVFVFDYQLSQDIGGGWAQKLEYAAITLNGINGYYELTNDSIRISCELVHLVEIKSEAENPYPASLAKVVHSVNDEKVLQFSMHEIAAACLGWLPKNKALLGSYDSVAIFVGVKGWGSWAGISPLAGACNEESAYAFGAAFDRGANFGGIAYMAHEIGHNLGAPHDGENATRTGAVLAPSTAGCPFKDGFLMGYERHNYTNAFRFSQCSLDAIKQYITSENASCVRPDHKTGRRAIVHAHAATASLRRTGGEHALQFDRDKVCAGRLELNFRGVATYKSPDEQCRVVDCEAKTKGQIFYKETWEVVPRGTSCGNNQRKGVCRSGFCIGQGRAVGMDSICGLATRFAGSKFDSEGASTRAPLESICDGRTQWSCLDEGNTLREFNKTTVIVGTPCSGDGAKVCFKKQCVEKTAITDRNKECILETGKEEAVQVPYEHSNPKCAGLIKCVYGTEHEFIGPGSTDPVCNQYVDAETVGVGRLEQRSGDQQTGEGEDTANEATPTPKPGRTLQEICDELTGEIGSKVANKPKSDAGSGSRDELCSKLQCARASDGKIIPAFGDTANGTICGPLRRCQGGKCKPCGQQ